jgi:sortase B
MEKKKKIIGITVISVFCALAIFFGAMFLHQYWDAKNSEQVFDNLTELIVETQPLEEAVEETEAAEDTEDKELTDEELTALEATLAHEKYAALFEQNQDFIGWISIEGTNINYPVMQSPSNPNYYLKHSFEKTYSNYGVPYIDEACVTGISNNIVIYGHNMKNGSMFNQLCNYADVKFYQEHQTIQFDTLSTFGEYQVVAVFKFDTNNEAFCYNDYTQMDEEQFAEFMENVHARQLYDTGVDAEYGDQLLTLSTCEYTYSNGRLVVVAKKV